MKKIVFLLAMIMLASTPMLAQQEQKVEQTTKEAEKAAKKAEKEAKKAAKKAEKEAKKAQEKAMENAMFEMAVKALENKKFVLKADQVTLKRGQTAHVNSTTNFVSLNGDEASIQLAFNTVVSGPNGIGGVTVDGKASSIKMETDKKGNILFEMHVQGIGVSAKLSFRMLKGSNRCSATVNPNFNSGNISFSGLLTPLGGGNNVFKGNSL